VEWRNEVMVVTCGHMKGRTIIDYVYITLFQVVQLELVILIFTTTTTFLKFVLYPASDGQDKTKFILSWVIQ
jgi:hypothetical protein